MELIDIIGFIAGICTATSLLPQLITTLKQKKAQEVSLFMFIVLLMGNALWIWFGVAKSELPIILTNSFSLLLNIIMLVLKYKYKDNE
ncbi:MtN3 and saliva related transmembrane protein [Chitinophaga rupis]|uniref:MtN3 and saliva related transmembrane protein n=1 Tax=Chitinophaga rupis TaxID=573321 RepID=A0A1H8G845_9BACT|nr:SemiSWEET transporter [Chitinophaga rupis]SEN39458.1 MtN3 and saliva related transmembrane protein [Chitinophaga rupis]